MISSSSCVREKLYGGKLFLLLLSLYWTFEVCSNIINCTVARSVSKWWTMNYHQSDSHEVVMKSFVKSVTVSLGSICLGALLVAIIRSVRQLFYASKKYLAQANTSSIVATRIKVIVVYAIEVILGMLDSMATYFNHYAMCFVGIYGHSFFEASR